MRYVELRRHTENNGDKLTEAGVAAAQEFARNGATPPYSTFVSTGTWRAGEVLTIVRTTLKLGSVPIIDEPDLRSRSERQWREAAKEAAESKADDATPTIEDIRAVDPELVEKDTWQLGLALRGIISRIPEGGRALVVGHSPSNEAAVLGLTDELVEPLDYGEGVLIVEDNGTFGVSRLA